MLIHLILPALAGVGVAVSFEGPRELVKRASLPPKYDIKALGVQRSNLPNIFRDGGGGATINGTNVIWYSDGTYTSDGKAPTGSNTANFTSNSIAASGLGGQPITSMTDYGTAARGPRQAVPFYYNNGESESVTGIWPNEPITALCSGQCGVSFPQVINRTAYRLGTQAALYNTPVQISFGAQTGPVVTRPAQKLFVYGEPAYGTFSSFAGIDGYLYTFAHVTGTNTSNGLKMARVPQGSWYDRGSYSYWTGRAWSAAMPKYDDGGAANIFNWTEGGLDGKPYGPGTGNIFYSQVYGVYLLLFQSDTALDNNVYLSYSKTNDISSAFSAPVVMTKLNSTTGAFTYSFNAYSNYDPTGKVVPISWSSAPSNSNSNLTISMANVTFS